MEKLLHYVWQHRLFPASGLATTDGRAVDVVDPGLYNRDAGPDFFNAKVRLGGTMWAGNVELHLRAADWYFHGHDSDPRYDNTILHVVCEAGCEVTTASGRRPPQLVVAIPRELRRGYEELLATMDYPRCHRIIKDIPRVKAHGWVDALLVERLRERAEAVLARLKASGGDWEATLFQTLARTFGFGVNGDAFEAWAARLPLTAVAKHRDDLFQVEAFFLGTAGLLAPEALPKSSRAEATNDDYYRRLTAEYAYLAHKFTLPHPLGPERWKFLRMRPQNFPHLRLSQLAALYHEARLNLSALLDADCLDALIALLDVAPSAYWRTHYLFGVESAASDKRLTTATRRLIVINAIVPVLYAYGLRHADDALCERAIALLAALPPEANFIIRQWRECGLSVDTAADTQALIQLKRRYCDTHDCLRCRFGYEFLRHK